MSMVKKSITVTDQQDSWIKAQIEMGYYGNESEIVQAPNGPPLFHQPAAPICLGQRVCIYDFDPYKIGLLISHRLGLKLTDSIDYDSCYNLITITIKIRTFFHLPRGENRTRFFLLQL